MVEEKRRRGCCAAFCSNVSVLFLVVVNFAIGLGGVMLVGFGGYMLSNFSEFEDLVSQNAVIYILITGIILFLLSIVAIVAALNRFKKILSIYVVFLLLLIVGEIIVVIVILEYLGVISGASDGDQVQVNSEDLNSREIVISNFLLRTYQTCCVDEVDICGGLCTAVVTCADGVQGVCVVGDEVGRVDGTVCTGLDNLDATLIDPPPGGCGGGDPEAFVSEVGDLFFDQVQIISIFVGVVAFLELLLIVFTMFLIFGKRVNYDKSTPWDELPAAEAIAVPAQSSADRIRESTRQKRQSIGARAANFSSSSDEPAAPPIRAPAKAPANARLSLTRRQMQDDPNVIESVL